MHRFSFDLGSGSLGWAVFRLDEDERRPAELVDLGVRIFPTGRDPQSRESNALGRRQPRQQRRQIDRRKKRREELEAKLVAHGLMPPAEEVLARTRFFELDPYLSRDRAARGEAEILELGRAIWHISKHRGFKSNRKADRANEDEKGKIATAAAELRSKLADAGVPTYGAWLADRHRKGEAVRVRPAGERAAVAYEFYPTRAMLEDEFDHMWRVQARHHPSLTEATRADIRDSVFFQRPLKPVDPGRCTFFPEDPRLPKWHPLAQEFTILQQLNMLRLIDAHQGERPLDLAQRDLLIKHLMSGEKLTWSGLRRRLKIPSEIDVNLEKGGLKELAHDAVAARLAGTRRKPGPLAAEWLEWDDGQRLRVLRVLDEAATPGEAIERLVNECEIEEDTAEQVERITLPHGHLMLGERAVRPILEVMREEVIAYSEAVDRASAEGLFGDGVVIRHSDFRPDGDPGLPRLPRYYELPVLQRMIGTGTGNPDHPPEIRLGKISNPTVHIALGQFRRVMNALIERYGKPAQVVIEATRDMAKSARELSEIENEIRRNTKRNDAWREELEEEGLLAPGQHAGDRLLRMRLWEELGKTPADRLCPYSGRPIALHQLHSDAVEIDHILPFEDTFDDTPANKTVCFRAANRVKGKRAPGDAWSGEELEQIVARVKGAPGMSRKLWRFLPGAMEKWQEQRGFEDRQLHATGYLARVVRAYAEELFPKDGTSNIWMPQGRMTAMMRRRWRLHLPDHNAKTRDDYRHHALDAATVGAIDRRMIQVLQTHARRVGGEELDRILPDPPEPFEGFRDQVLGRVARIQASHRPDRPLPSKEAEARRQRGEKIIPSVVSGKLHEDTAYGRVRDLTENQADRTLGNLVVRKPVTALTAREIGQVRDQKLREELLAATEGVRGDKKALAEAVKAWSDLSGHRRLRILVTDESARPILGRPGKPRAGEPYKWVIPNENAFIDVLQGSDGRWFRYGTDLWAAASGTARSWQEAHPEARFIMRLYKGDTIQLFDWNSKEKTIAPGSNRIMLVTSIPNSLTNNYVRFKPVNDATNENSTTASFDMLRKRRARRVRIDETGRVRIVPHGVI